MTTPTASYRSRVQALVTGDALQRILALGALVVLLLFFSAISPPFRTTDNFTSILVATAVNGILAMGVTFVIITGGIDLSVGTTMTLCTVVLGLTVTKAGLPLWIGLPAAMAAGAFLGTLNGLLIAKAKLPPFIATLGMLNVARGLAQILSDVKPIYFEGNPEFYDVFMGKPLLGIPNVVFVMFGAAVIAHVVLTRTVLGRYTFALGSNEEATRLSGVNVDRWKIAVYALCGLFAGLAGILIGARMTSAQPSVGLGYELDAIAAAVIGGTSLSGGEGSIVGTIIGAFIISTLTIGLSIVGVPDQWKLVITGLVVIGAVWLDILRRRNRA
ncbi:MAG TPA: ABC transporter permease [Candidatus Limnocylindrales bacterium]|nr:ABC transporter permease [Candidatus Limnocylindrales bacterium]